MSTLRLLFLLCFVTLLPNFSRHVDAQNSPSLTELEEQAFKQAVALAEPSIVRIQTVGGLDRVGRILTSTGPTTGLVVSADGYIISSAFNFISKPASVLVEFADGRRFPAEVIATDRSRMLTLLKIEADNLQPAEAVPADQIKVGQWGVAAGRTYSPEIPNVSVGIVSAINRVWGKAIQTDAKVSPVNYGGPLLNIEGKVMGVLVPLSASANTETAGVEWYDSGIGFAIPLEDVYQMLERLKEGEDLHPGLMGVTFRRNDLMEGDLLIDMVRPDSPAYRAGMRRGDVLLSVDDIPLTRVGHLRYALGTHYAGDVVPVTFLKNQKKIETTMALVQTLIPYESGFLGILPQRPELTAPRNGVVVRYVYSESAAEDAGIKKDDRIVAFQGEPVTDYESLWTLISRERPENEVSVTFERGALKETVKLTLTGTTEEIPLDLLDEFIPPPAADEVDEDLPTGFTTIPMEAHNHEYWTYIPADYNPAYQYGLVVWIHPGGDTMEASIAQDWQRFCDRRGIILIGPKAAKINSWNLNEAEFIKDAVLDIQTRYNIDTQRVALHGYASGGSFALHLAFKYRDLFRAAAIAAAPITAAPPENDPETRFQVYLTCGEEDAVLPKVEATQKIMEARKFPSVFKKVEGRGHTYPTSTTLEEIAIWLDTLDRL
jgi:serine protease Do